ncbi:MAG: TaqI-like C-terminal specificity domain-containing protein [Crocinitomicaceae bacterium]
MPFFQNSVLNKQLKTQDEKAVLLAYEQFTAYFHNPAIQQNIRDSKEEQFQEGFLRELFVNILGYTLNPQPDYNLTTELKNEKGAKKVDGAIFNKGMNPLGKNSVLAVIELKGTDTKDLDKINTQAFNYKNNHTACVYVITSNFEKLRFFIHNAVEHLEFNLFTLTQNEFKVLWLCLKAEHLLSGLPLKVKEESLLAEENITKQLYKDYSAFRTDLWRNMAGNHPNDDQLMLFKKTQKLLDRFLFIFFAEDSGLLPPNSITKIIEKWQKDKDWGESRKLYDIYRQYFGFINSGRPAGGERAEIFGYNGGLFQDDLILDNINIDDEVLLKHTQKLTAYDFQSEVDVNILGHIFENSLNEIESITAELEGQEIDKSKSKRKKDGVFYTPKYITKYIVDNTIGKLCEEKKAELDITDERFGQASKRSKKGIADLKAYRDWLLDLKICDPACGSGAFLNQALEFLMEEHQYLDELTAQYHKVPLVLSDIETQILEQNIYGVDINEESVEIAKLALWLRTAQRGRKLTSLNNNIKCGNSLIDDPKIAGEKAFNWQKEFPAVFEEKNKKAFHITTATHDSRTSQRMIDHKVRLKRDNGQRPKAQPIWLETEDEILITNTIAQIVKEDDLNVMAYNICGDHLHLLLVCDEEEVTKIVGKIKGITAKEYNTAIGITTRGHVPLTKEEKKNYNSLWTQKFGNKPIKDDKQLWNTVEYIQKNRDKHGLPNNKKLNSTIENFVCTYDHALRTEYKGGFDVVIGNPPYVSSKGDNFTQPVKEFLNKKYKTAVYQIDLYILFMERMLEINAKNGLVSIIIPNAWLNNLFLKEVRKFLLSSAHLKEIVTMPTETFADANVDTVIVTYSDLQQETETKLKVCHNQEFNDIGTENQLEWQNNDGYSINVSASKEIKSILSKFKKNVVPLSSFTEIGRGVGVYHKRVGHTKEFISKDPYQSETKVDETFVPYLRGKNVNRWKITWNNDSYISYGKWLAEPREPKFFEGKRLILRQIPSKRLIATYIEDQFIIDQSVFIARFLDVEKFNPLETLAILNSGAMSFYFRYKYSEFDDLFPKVKLQHFKDFPISLKIKNGSNLEKISAKRLELERFSFSLEKKFCNYLKHYFKIHSLGKKLEGWSSIDFGVFIKELNKAIKKADGEKLSKTDEMEWMELFEAKKTEALKLKAEIDKTDKEIDKMVYELYGLTEEEIGIVEGL